MAKPLRKYDAMSESIPKNYYVYFGQNGWTKKFHEVFKTISGVTEGLRVSGLIASERLLIANQRDQSECNFYGDIDCLPSLLNKFSDYSNSLDEIASLESELDINFWRFLYAERRFIRHHYRRKYVSHEFTHNELANLACCMVKFFNEKLEGVDCVVMQNPSSGWSYLLALLAVKRGIKLRAVRSLGLPNHSAIWGFTPFEEYTDVNELFFKYRDGLLIPNDLRETAQDTIDKFLQTQEGPAWLAAADTQANLRWNMFFQKTKYLLQKLLSREFLRPSKFYSPMTMFQEKIKFKLRKLCYQFLLKGKYHEQKTEQKFALFFLSVEPESAISVNAENCFNQLALIENIARQLPINWKLYVKEHPVMLGWRPASFYNALRKIPNVGLVAPELNAGDLSKKSQLVLTINGSVGLEAALNKIPVITFGKSLYNELSSVVHCENMSSIYSCIKITRTVVHDNDEHISFLSALTKFSFPCPYDYHWGIDDNNPEKVLEYKYVTEHLANSLLNTFKAGR